MTPKQPRKFGAGCSAGLIAEPDRYLKEAGIDLEKVKAEARSKRKKQESGR